MPEEPEQTSCPESPAATATARFQTTLSDRICRCRANPPSIRGGYPREPRLERELRLPREERLFLDERELRLERDEREYLFLFSLSLKGFSSFSVS